MFQRSMAAALVLLFSACELQPEPAADYASAAEQLAGEFGEGVDARAVDRVLEISREMVLDRREAGVTAMVTALKRALTRQGRDSAGLDGITDFNLGEPLPGVGEYFESSSADFSSQKQALGPNNPNEVYFACPPIQQPGSSMSCTRLVDSVLAQVRSQVSSEEALQEARIQIEQDPTLQDQTPEFQDYAREYLAQLALTIERFGIDVAAIRAEYTLREAEVCDHEPIDGEEIARLRGIEESVAILRQLIGRGTLELAPQGDECLQVGQTGPQTDARIKQAIDQWVEQNPLCDDMSATNPQVIAAEDLRRDGIERGIKAHTTTIWVGIIRDGIETSKGSRYTVAVVDGCEPKDQATYTTSPLVIDLAGDGLQLTTRRVSFDLLATGQPQRVTWADRSEGLLALDLDGDGRITSGRELFGDRSECAGVKCKDGAAALAIYDRPELGGNADGMIDAQDEVFDRLLVWVDRNQDGQSQPDELAPLSAHGITALSLAADYFDRRVPAGRISLSLAVHTNDGPRLAYDVWFDNLVSPGFPRPLQ